MERIGPKTPTELIVRYYRKGSGHILLREKRGKTSSTFGEARNIFVSKNQWKPEQNTNQDALLYPSLVCNCAWGQSLGLASEANTHCTRKHLHLNYPPFWLLCVVTSWSGTGNDNFWKRNGNFRSVRTDWSKTTTSGGGPLWRENFHLGQTVPFTFGRKFPEILA